MLIGTTLLALLSGACAAGFIALVNTALTSLRPTATTVVVGALAGFGLGKVLTHFLSEAMLARLAQRTAAELRRELMRRILAVPLRKLEEIGAPSLLVALTDDVLNLTQALLAIPPVLVCLAMLLGGAAYLGWLSWQVLLLVLATILIGVVGYRLAVASAFRCLKLAREEEGKLFGCFQALTHGIKELKLHRNRRSAFLFGKLQAITEAYQRQSVAAELRFILAQSWLHLVYLALLGLVLFLAPQWTVVTRETLTGYVITILYLLGPLTGVVSALSLFGRASVSLAKVEQLGASLAGQPADAGLRERPDGPLSFSCLELSGVTHAYRREQDDNPFVLGPISLSFRPGQLVFLVGGNGSGKSTLAKVITGLYAPESGRILLDGQPVTAENRDDYRQLFSAVFADFYLFDSLLGLDHAGMDRQAESYLQQLHLSRQVRIIDGRLSTTAVSQGQRKRLALLTAFLEDRPFYLFDEWAADQDPHFKEVFYRGLLPELKARGKTIVVITHDEQYFGLADRLVRLDYGKIVSGPGAGTEEPGPGAAAEQDRAGADSLAVSGSL